MAVRPGPQARERRRGPREALRAPESRPKSTETATEVAGRDLDEARSGPSTAMPAQRPAPAAVVVVAMLVAGPGRRARAGSERPAAPQGWLRPAGVSPGAGPGAGNERLQHARSPVRRGLTARCAQAV